MVGCRRVRKFVEPVSNDASSCKGLAGRAEPPAEDLLVAAAEGEPEGFVLIGLEDAPFPESGGRLTVGQVERLTGVTVAALRHYDKVGLLCPERTGDSVANNRKLYGPDDLARLQSIVTLRGYGFELGEIACILDGDIDVCGAMECKLMELRRQERMLRNLVLFAKFVGVVDDDVLEGLANGPARIDMLSRKAEGARAYRAAMLRLDEVFDAVDFLQDIPLPQGLQEGQRPCDPREGSDVQTALEKLDAIVAGFSMLDESEGFDGLRRVVDSFCGWWSDLVFPLDALGYLGFWAAFEDHALIPERIERAGGQGSPGFLAMSVFFTRLKLMMEALSDVVCEVARVSETDVVLAIERAEHLVDVICLHMAPWAKDAGSSFAREVAGMALEYMEAVLDDTGLRLHLGFDESMGLSSDDVRAALRVVRLMG